MHLKAISNTAHFTCNWYKPLSLVFSHAFCKHNDQDWYVWNTVTIWLSFIHLHLAIYQDKKYSSNTEALLDIKTTGWRKQSLLTSLMVIHLYLHWLSFSFVSSPLLCRWNKCVAKTISHAPSFLNRRKSHRDSDDMMFNCLLK